MGNLSMGERVFRFIAAVLLIVSLYAGPVVGIFLVWLVIIVLLITSIVNYCLLV